MILTFNKGRMAVTAVACAIVVVVGLVLLIAVFEVARYSIPMSMLRGATIGGTVAAAIFAVVFTVQAVNAGNPVVTIDDRGIEVHRKELGLIPWSAIETAGIERIAGAKRLAVYMAPPAPKPGFMTKLLFGLVVVRRGDRMRLTLPFGRFDADEAAVQARLDARGAQA